MTGIVNTAALPDLSASWMKDGTVPNDPGFIDFMKQVALGGFKNFVDSYIGDTQGAGLPAGDIARNPDGSIDYTKTDLGGNDHNLAAFYQELGEGDQGKRLYDMYKQGLTADQVNKTFQDQTDAYKAVQSLGQGNPVTPDIQKMIDSGAIVKTQADNGDGTTGYIYKMANDATPGLVAQPLFNHQTQTGMDESKIIFDPNRGFLTSAGNVHSTEGAGADKFWDTASSIIPGVMIGPLMAPLAAGLGAGLGFADSIAGAMGQGVLNVGRSLAMSGSINPADIAKMAASFMGIDPSLIKAAGYGLDAYNAVTGSSENIKVTGGGGAPSGTTSTPETNTPGTGSQAAKTTTVPALTAGDESSILAGQGIPTVTHGANSALPAPGNSALPGPGGASALPGKGIVSSATGL